jgi:hypothetical protein
MQGNTIIDVIQNDINELKNRLLEIDSNKKSILSSNEKLEKQISIITLSTTLLERFSKTVSSTTGLSRYHILRKIYININMLFYNTFKMVSSMHKGKIDLDFRFLKDYDTSMLNIKKNWLDSENLASVKEMCSNEDKLKMLEFEYILLTCKIKDLEAILAMDESFRKKLF